MGRVARSRGTVEHNAMSIDKTEDGLVAFLPVQDEQPHCENCGAVGVELQELMCRSCWESNPEGSRFHWRDGVYFQRVDQGAVLMTLPNTWKMIPANEWDSIVAHLSRPVQDEAPKAWRCFHCDEVFTDEAEARAHFGEDQTGTTPMGESACRVAASEGGLLKALRESEREVGSLRHQAEQLDYEAGHAATMTSDLTRHFGDGVRTPYQAWLKLEAMESRAMAAEEQLAAALGASRPSPADRQEEKS